MRLIHTSDWHLGQTLHQFERYNEHEAFLTWLRTTLVTQEVDVLLISGDIFDTANPSASAQKQFYRFLQQAKIASPTLQIVIIAGNHDSPGRLEAPAPLMESLDATVIGFIPRLENGDIDLQRLVIPLHDKQHRITAWCLAIPFLRPGDVPRVEGARDPYMEGIALLYRQATDYALSVRQDDQAIIALGHCHMVGGEVSESSERPIVIGGTEALSANVFDTSIAYAALGHLHLAQKVGKKDHLRYCGSPIPLSFAEVDYQHQVLQIDLDGDTVTQITSLPVPRSVELLRIPRQPQSLAKVLVALTAIDIPQDTPPNSMPFLEVRVLLDVPEPTLRATIEQAIEGKRVRLAKIDTHFTHASAEKSDIQRLEELEKLQPQQIFERLYQRKYGTKDPSEIPAEITTAFAELLLGTPEVRS